jgi:DNA-binding PadR family transcriptional regulator
MKSDISCSAVAKMTTEDFVSSKLEHANRSGGGWMARCPAHDDRNPSLKIDKGRGGATLLKCHAGCTFAAIVAAVGVEPSELGSQNGAPGAKYVLESTFLYENADGSTRYRVQRKVNPFNRKDKTYPQNPPDGSDGWKTGAGAMEGVGRILYRLPEVMAADPSEVIFICGGEKCVDAVRGLGLIATCNSGGEGVGKFGLGGGPDYLDPLKGHPLIILADSDLPDPKQNNRRKGYDHAQDVARKVKPVAASVKAFELPGVPVDGGDVYDWIKAGGTRERLFALVDKAPEWTATEPAVEADAEDEPRFNIVHADELAHFKPAEMIKGTVLVSGGMNLLFGQPEAGKSLYAILTAVALSLFMPVLYIAAEGVCGLYLRLRALELQSRITYRDLYILTSEVNLMDPLECQLLVATIRSKSIQPKLIVFDTWARCMVGGEENSNSDMGVAIANVAMIMRAFSSTAWLLHHPTKDGRWERGAGALRGAIDSSVEITNTDGLVKLELSKLKDGERWEPQFFRILSKDVGEGRTAPCLVRSDSTSTAGERLTEQQLKALEFLALPVFEDYGAHAKDIETVGKIPHASLFRVLSALKENGFITQGKRGDPYTITDAGRAKLAQIRGDTTGVQYHTSITAFSQASTKKSQADTSDAEESNLWEDREFIS